MIINSRTDLDAIAGTPEHADFMRMLEGSLWKLEKTEAGWKVLEDDSTVRRFGFTRADFPGATPPNLPVDPPLTVEQVEAKVAAKIEALWQAADRYTSGYISGVAVGILTLGVLQQKPKAMAVTTWSSAIWAEYYARKALVTADSVDNHDFSSFGPIPYSVPELQEEVGL